MGEPSERNVTPSVLSSQTEGKCCRGNPRRSTRAPRRRSALLRECLLTALRAKRATIQIALLIAVCMRCGGSTPSEDDASVRSVTHEAGIVASLRDGPVRDDHAATGDAADRDESGAAADAGLADGADLGPDACACAVAGILCCANDQPVRCFYCGVK